MAGAALLGLSLLNPTLPPSAAIHALTIGAIGTMMLAVMTRATRGHTGCALAADGVTGLIYVLVAAVVALVAFALLAAPGEIGTAAAQTAPTTTVAPEGVSIARDPADVPPPVGERAPTNVRIDLEAVERVGRLDAHTTYNFWTFNGKIPGPMLRVRVGDTVELHLKNAKDDVMPHSIDLHAVTGTGGGAALTEVDPGEEKGFVFKALMPGLYVYHCATPMVANHISNGMYGMILVEPPGGVPKVDHEFYIMQGELYTGAPFGTSGLQEMNLDKLVDEHPDYFTFNGAVGALTEEHPLRSKVGDSVRIFFGVGGPNFTSSFHVIGQIFDRAFEDGGITSAPLTGIQAISVPPGSAAMVEFTTKVPGKFTIVDHALSRLEKGLAGSLIVDGPDQPDLYRAITVKGADQNAPQQQGTH